MAEIHGFRGLRYDLGRVGALSDVIAPPYDVIDDALSAALHGRNEYNVIRLILNPILSSDNETDNRYTRSARLLKEWRREGILVEEAAPCLYVYYQTFTWEGQVFTRRGVMARMRLEPFGSGKVFPHEETLSGPKADRLKLFHATGMNLSQIFGLYPDPENHVAERLDQAVLRLTPLEAVDHLQVTHRLWMVSDPKTISELQALVGPLPLFIADGHHRYETGLKHLEERRAAGLVRDADDPANFILMMMVGMSDPGLQIMPTHRLVKGVGNLTADRLESLLGQHFHLESIGRGAELGRLAWESVLTSGRQDVFALGTTADDTWTVATLKSPASMDAIVTDHTPVWKSLGVSILHRLLLDHCLGSLGKAQCQYVHLTDEVLSAMARGTCQVGCLVQPASVAHVQEVAGNLEKMPPKSTYFYPKLASGLVFNPIQPS